MILDLYKIFNLKKFIVGINLNSEIVQWLRIRANQIVISEPSYISKTSVLREHEISDMCF